MKRLLFLLLLLVGVYIAGRSYDLIPKTSLDQVFPISEKKEEQTVVYEESTVTKVVEKTLPSVVTVGISKTTTGTSLEIDPSDPFSIFRRTPTTRRIEGNIGSGFVVSKDGLIVTSKHVVADTQATYTVLSNSKKSYKVEKIYRDPLNDLALLKINASGLTPLPLGDSKSLKLGQLAIAIGTPLGEFTNTVTVGIVSGLGRGITAGSPFEGFVEKLENVIQTDAAISAGNSGGPLLNSAGQVIGVNTAIAAEGQNIGFAIPVNVVKDLMSNFQKQGGTFERPYIGIRYKFIDKETAVLNDLVLGAYVIEILKDSPAEKAGIQDEDVITAFDGKRIEDDSLTKLVAGKKIGDKVNLTIWRSGQTRNVSVILEASP